MNRRSKKAAPLIHEMSFERWPIDRPKYHPCNQRQGDVGAICESIDANGFYGAILVQKSTEFILAGEHRHRSMKAGGAKEIPVLVIEVDDERALDILLADNATNDQADYNRAGLASLLEEIHERRGTLAGTGYTEERLQELLDDLKPREEESPAAEAKEKDAPNLDPGEDRYQEQYGVIVVCRSEAEQERVFNALSLEYDNVKVVVT